MVGPVEADLVFGVVEAGLFGEAHVAFEDGVVAEGEVGRLVAFGAFAVSGAMIDVVLDTLFDLVFVNGVGHAGAGGAFFLQFDLHVAGVLADFPEFAHVGIEFAGVVSEDVHAIVFAAVAADVGVAIDLQRHVARNAIEARLVGMRIGAERADAAIDFDARLHAVMRRAIGEIEIGVEHVVDPEGRGDGDFIVGDVSAVGEDVVARVGVGAIEIGVGATSEGEFFGRFHFAEVEEGLADVNESDFGEDFFGGGEVFGGEFAVEANFVAGNTFGLDAFEEHLEEVDSFAFDDFALLGEAAFGVLGVEIFPAAAEPPAFYEVAIERGIKVEGRLVVLIHVDALRALGVGVPVAGDVDDVELIAEEEGGDLFFGQLFAEAREGLLVPVEGKAIGGGGLRRAFFAGDGLNEELFAGAGGAGFDDVGEGLAFGGGGLQAVDAIHAFEEAAAEQGEAAGF